LLFQLLKKKFHFHHHQGLFHQHLFLLLMHHHHLLKRPVVQSFLCRRQILQRVNMHQRYLLLLLLRIDRPKHYLHPILQRLLDCQQFPKYHHHHHLKQRMLRMLMHFQLHLEELMFLQHHLRQQ
jgi:hypothetical protein